LTTVAKLRFPMRRAGGRSRKRATSR